MPTADPPQPKVRRPRHKHQPDPSRAFPLEMIQQAMPTLLSLDWSRLLTNAQLCALLFRGRPNSLGATRTDQAAARAVNGMCLSRLKDRDLIAPEMIYLGDGPGSYLPKSALVLTKTGARLVQGYYHEMGVEQRVRPLRRDLRANLMNHNLLVRDTLIAAIRACEHQGWQAHNWLLDDDFRERQGTHFTGAIIPDGFFLIWDGERDWAQFVEIDMGSETGISGLRGGAITTKDWVAKVKGYLDYLPRYAADPLFRGLPTSGEPGAPLVLTVTTSRSRLATLREATQVAGGRGLFWFTTFDQLLFPLLDPQQEQQLLNTDTGRAEWTDYDQRRTTAFLHYLWSVPTGGTPRSLLDRVVSSGLSRRVS